MKILDLLFTNIPELIENVSVLGYKEACSSDHYGINFKIKLNVPMKKTVIIQKPLILILGK